MHPPRISIITAALNPGPEVIQTIESILSQDYPNLEYIFIDGNSGEKSLAYIEPHRHRFSAFIRERDEGIADAWNKGISIASGDIVGIINADDYLLPGALALIAEKFLNHQKPPIIHGNAIRIERDSKSIRRPTRPFAIMLRFGTPVIHPATFVPRTVYNRIGMFNKAYRIAMDYDFVLRAYLSGIRFEYLARPLVGFRGGGLSDRMPIEGFREVRNSQLVNGFNAPLTRSIYAAKFCVRKCLRPLLSRT